MKSYYLYRHVRLDRDEVFYVGVGTLNDDGTTHYKKYTRAYDKSKSRNLHWKNIFNKTPISVEIMLHAQDINEIINKEKEFIGIYKLKKDGGTLTNLTYGGHGIEGYEHTEENKKIIGYHSKYRIRKNGYKLNLTSDGLNNKIKYMKNRVVTKNTRNRMSNHMKGNTRGIGHVISEKNKKIMKIPKTCFKMDSDFNIVKKYKSLSQAKKEGYSIYQIQQSSKLKRLYNDYYWKIL